MRFFRPNTWLQLLTWGGRPAGWLTHRQVWGRSLQIPHALVQRTLGEKVREGRCQWWQKRWWTRLEVFNATEAQTEATHEQWINETKKTYKPQSPNNILLLSTIMPRNSVPKLNIHTVEEMKRFLLEATGLLLLTWTTGAESHFFY